MAVSNAELLAELEGLAGPGQPLSPRTVYEHGCACRDGAVGRWLEQKGAFDPARCEQGYGLLLAGILLRRVRVTVTRGRQEPRTLKVRAFYSIEQRRGEGEASYVPGALVFGDRGRELREQLARTVLSQLQGIRSQYVRLDALGDVWAAIDAAAARLGRREAG